MMSANTKFYTFNLLLFPLLMYINIRMSLQTAINYLINHKMPSIQNWNWGHFLLYGT